MNIHQRNQINRCVTKLEVLLMEEKELQLLEELAPELPELQELWENHLLYEKQLAKYERKSYLTNDEEIVVRQLKKEKLDGKTKMVQLINEHAKKDG